MSENGRQINRWVIEVRQRVNNLEAGLWSAVQAEIVDVLAYHRAQEILPEVAEVIVAAEQEIDWMEKDFKQRRKERIAAEHAVRVAGDEFNAIDVRDRKGKHLAKQVLDKAQDKLSKAWAFENTREKALARAVEYPTSLRYLESQLLEREMPEVPHLQLVFDAVLVRPGD